MKDLISREKAIAELWREPRYTDPLNVLAEARDRIEELPSEGPEWIPVSERLPEDEGWYLVTDDSGGVLWLEVEHYDPEFGLKPFCTIQNPVAWMSLPEPYCDADTTGGQI